MATHRLRKRVHEILEVAADGDTASRAFDLFIVSLIALNVVAFTLGTVESLYAKVPGLFRWFEIVSVGVFTAEYVLRLWSCTHDGRYGRPVRGRIRYALTPMLLIDLFAILPFYLPFVAVDLRFMRAVRLVRLFRVMKLARYSRAIKTLGRVVSAKKEELGVTLFVLCLLLIFASSLLYYAEHGSQPEHFSSIPAAMWWGVATLTTVGYGDVYPVTVLGKLLASAIAVLGIGMFALPTGVLGAGFVEEIQSRKRAPACCPHCGKALDS